MAELVRNYNGKMSNPRAYSLQLPPDDQQSPGKEKKKLKIIFLQNFPLTLLNTNMNLPNAMSLECA